MKRHVRERDWMGRWIKEHQQKYPEDYWLRIPDDSSGTKPFDGVLLTAKKGAIAIEFKVWRGLGPFRWASFPPHQLRELLMWKSAGGGAWVLVLHERTGAVRVYQPTRSLLKRAMESRA